MTMQPVPHSQRRQQCHCNKVGVRECGTRRQGCDESPGWVWSASTFLETYLLENLDRLLARQGKHGSGVRDVDIGNDQDIVTETTAASTSYRTDERESEALPPSPAPRGSTGDNCPCLHNQEFWRALKVLELGSGTGWLALRLAAHGASVVATDREGTLPLLAQNVVKNQHAFSLLQGNDDNGEEEGDGGTARGVELNVTVAPLEWKVIDENDDVNGDTSCLIRSNVNDVSASDLGGFRGWDAIVASDVLYLKELYADLLQTLKGQCLTRNAFLRRNEHCGESEKVRPTVVVVAWEERRPHEEARFAELASEMGFVFGDGTPRVVGTNVATRNRMWVATMSLGPTSGAGPDVIVRTPSQKSIRLDT